MPAKLVSYLFKPRNIRTFIFLMVVATLVFALYQLLLGSASESVPSIFLPNEGNNLLGNNYPEVIDGAIFANDIGKKLTATAKQKIPQLNLIPRYKEGFGTAATKYEKDRQTGRCPKIQIFKPDIDVTSIYPELDFNGDWIRTKEYWNAFFEKRYKSIQKSKDALPPLKVIVVPHSHNDPGWLKTFEDYYSLQTRHVLDNAVEKLTEFKDMTFIWSEISFLSKWWQDAHPRKRGLLKNLVKEGRFEIVTGGWVMTDEATVNLYSMIDQLIEGQQWVKSHLNVHPTSSWSVDPFGHGSTFPYILKQTGMTGMVIQRIHYGWKKFFMVNQSSDFQWVQRWDYSNKNSISCHNLPFDIYSIKHSCGPHPQICLNFDFKSIVGEYSENSMIMQPITSENIKEKSELLLEQYGRTASLFKQHNVLLVPLGDDFRYTLATEWEQQYTNYKLMFDYINSHKDRYNTEIAFGTVSDYFKALPERHYKPPTLSGDFHVYSDIFSDGSPAYWSGYYSTRPFWKKLYRETENSLRGAEILFTFANSLAHQRRLNQSQLVLARSYEDLTTARRWLALFAHHDATTGTSKALTMMDYGNKLLEAFQFGEKVQMNAIETIMYGKTGLGKFITDIETDGFGDPARQIPLTFDSTLGIRKIVVYNNLARHRYHVVKVVVTTPFVEVVGPSGEYVQAQLNPVLDVASGQMELFSDVFELSFLAALVPLSLSIYQVKKSTPSGEHNAVPAIIYCKSCRSEQKIFETNDIQKGDIQLNNDRLQVLFDRDTGMLMSITKMKEDISSTIDLKFGSYASTYFKSGAYLLKPDLTSEQQIPFPQSHPKIIIVSGLISSEISVFHSPLVLSTKIMHVGDSRILEAVYVQNQVDLGQHNGEVYMRFDTDLKSETKVHVPEQPNNIQQGSEQQETSHHQPTFYTDQSGYTVEKRIKVPTVQYEGNNYPVNTMAYVQDDNRKLRFSVLVDRSHGFSSMESGRLETLIERRTVYDDSRGMGEGVTDNRPTISNYILLLEKLGPSDKVRHAEKDYRNTQPTLAAYHHSQELSYPAFAYLFAESTDNSHYYQTSSPNTIDIFPLISQELPCDSHLINLRTITDTMINPDLNFPSGRAILVVQKLGYLCISNDEKPGCGNPNPSSLFYPTTKFNGLKVKNIEHSNLVGFVERKKGAIANLHDIEADPFEISSVVVTFN